MNLPNFLAAPTFKEEAHGFDFPLHVKRLGYAGWEVRCKCGAEDKLRQDEVVLAIDKFWPFKRWMEKHVAEEERKSRIVDKWGGAAAFAPESAERALEIPSDVKEALVVDRIPEGAKQV